MRDVDDVTPQDRVADISPDSSLDLVGRQPRVAASRLAKSLGCETAPFKADVVKLKKLGLTQSFEVGDEVSPRGKAYLAARAQDARFAKRRR